MQACGVMPGSAWRFFQGWRFSCNGTRVEVVVIFPNLSRVQQRLKRQQEWFWQTLSANLLCMLELCQETSVKRRQAYAHYKGFSDKSQ